jgi:hypothetical protein
LIYRLGTTADCKIRRWSSSNDTELEVSYEKIDVILYPWAERHDLTVMTESGDSGRRFFYKSNEAGETFQVVIEPENKLSVRIDGHLIETFSENEVHYMWETSIDQLGVALDVVKKTIEVWLSR